MTAPLWAYSFGCSLYLATTPEWSWYQWKNYKYQVVSSIYTRSGGSTQELRLRTQEKITHLWTVEHSSHRVIVDRMSISGKQTRSKFCQVSLVVDWARHRPRWNLVGVKHALIITILHKEHSKNKTLVMMLVTPSTGLLTSHQNIHGNRRHWSHWRNGCWWCFSGTWSLSNFWTSNINIHPFITWI